MDDRSLPWNMVPQISSSRIKTPIVRKYVDCDNDLSRLDQCYHGLYVEGCSHKHDAGANCTVIKG